MLTKLFAVAVLAGGVTLAGLTGGGAKAPERSDCCFPGSPCCYPGSPCCDANCCAPGADCCFPGSPCCGK
jgi:hypothetical protein